MNYIPGKKSIIRIYLRLVSFKMLRVLLLSLDFFTILIKKRLVSFSLDTDLTTETKWNGLLFEPHKQRLITFRVSIHYMETWSLSFVFLPKPFRSCDSQFFAQGPRALFRYTFLKQNPVNSGRGSVQCSCIAVANFSFFVHIHASLASVSRMYLYVLKFCS